MTLTQAFKVWWSYSWRASLLVIPLWIVIMLWSLMGIASTLETIVGSGQSLENISVAQLGRLLSGGVSLSILSMVLTALIQVYAMRWTLNSRWSDFRLKAVPPEAEAGNQPARV